MESYFERGGGDLKETSTTFKPNREGAIPKATAITLNPQSQEFQPTLVSPQQQPSMQQQRQHALWSMTEVKGHSVQSNEIMEQGQTFHEPLLDHDVPPTNPTEIQSQASLQRKANPNPAL